MLQENAMVSYNNGNLSAGGTNVNNCNDYWNNWYQPYVYSYPVYHYCNEKSKVEQGFKIVAKLLESKIITKELTIKEFIKLVNDIAEIL
jgi:hypothetical protein